MKKEYNFTAYKLRTPLVLMLFILVGSVTHAATITVSPDGTRDYVTIQAAVNAAAEGDIVDVYPGEYDESVALAKMLHLRAVKGPLLTKIIGPGDGVVVTGPNSRIEGFAIAKAQNAITTTVTCYVYNCILTGQGGSGFVSNAKYIYPVLINCLLANSSEHGVINNNYNTIVYCRNSIIYKNQKYGICAGYNSNECEVMATYCCFFENVKGSKGLLVYYGSPIIGDGCLDLTNPQFQNPDEFDYRLSDATEGFSKSPCIDSGDSVPGSRDPDGTRNDMGIFGGPYAASFWYGPLDGPAVRDLQVIPPVVQYGNPFRIRATAEIR